jgi:hypothetical protein
MKSLQDFTVPVETAAATGYRPITTIYSMPSEAWMLEAVVRDMLRGGIEFVVVIEGPGARSVWRKGIVEQIWSDDP